MHRNHPNWFANFNILIMSFIAMLRVSRSPFSAWSDRCLTFFSLVRHMSQLFQFLTQTRTFHSPQAKHSNPCILHAYPRVSVCFALTLTIFQQIVWNKWQICCWWFKSTPCLAPSQFCLGPICLTSPSTFLN